MTVNNIPVMDTATMESLKRLIDYVYEEEHTSYMETDPKVEHVFNDILLLDNWLKENKQVSQGN